MRNIVLFVLLVGACMAGYLYYNGELTFSVDEKKVVQHLAVDPFTSAALAYDEAKYDDAFQAYTQGLQTAAEGPDAQTARYRLAQCLDKLNRKPEAIAAYKSFLDKYPDDPRGTEAKKRMEWLSAGM